MAPLMVVKLFAVPDHGASLVRSGSYAPLSGNYAPSSEFLNRTSDRPVRRLSAPLFLASYPPTDKTAKVHPVTIGRSLRAGPPNI